MQRFKNLVTVFSVLFALASLGSLPMLAQTFRGGINGAVTDSTGGAIPGAQVTATETSTGTVYHAVASSAGEFSFNDLPLGTYNVSVNASGFETVQVTGVSVSAGKVYTLPVKLGLAQQSTTIEVAADALRSTRHR